MKKLLCLALSLVLCLSLFAGCGSYDIENADLESFVTLGDIDAFTYDDLAKHYQEYRVKYTGDRTSFYLSTGYTLAFSVKSEVLNEDGSYSAVSDWTCDVSDYDVYRYTANSVFDKALVYALEDASKNSQTPRLVRIGEDFSFTMPIDEKHENEAVAGKTVKFTVNVKNVVMIPDNFSDTAIMADLQDFYNKYAEEKKIVEMGDTVQIDFVGKIDGVAFQGGTGDDFVFVVGEGGFVANFEEQLIGHKNGEKFDITITFPEDYDEDLAGKEAVFSIKIDEISNDNAIIAENSPFADIWELKEYYRILHYIEFGIVDYVADISTMKSLPEELVDDFRDIYQDYVERTVTEQIAQYAEQGETYTKEQMLEKIYPNGSDKDYVERMAKDAAYNYILVHLLMKKLNVEYTDKQYDKDVSALAAEYTAYYGETYTVKDMEKMMGKEVIRLSFIDAFVASKLAEKVSGIPQLAEAKN